MCSARFFYFLFIFHSFYAQQILCAFNCAPDDIIDGICRSNSSGVHGHICASPHRHSSFLSVSLSSRPTVRSHLRSSFLCASVHCGAHEQLSGRSPMASVSQRRAYWHFRVWDCTIVATLDARKRHFVANNVAHLFHAKFHLCN